MVVGSPRAVLMEVCAVLGIAACVGLLAFRPIFAVDLFWLLALGRELARAGRLPTTDLFSAVHPDAAWVQFQWLWELLGHGLVEAAGLSGLRATNATCIAAGFVGLYVVSRRAGLSAGGALLSVAFGLLLFVDRFRLRPDALNFALMVPTLPVFAGGYRYLTRRGRLGMGAWCFLWSSLHGGGVLWPVASAGALVVGALAGRARTDRTAAVRLLVACVVGALLSPASLAGLAHFFAVYGQMSAGSPEWSPSWTALSERQHPVNYLILASPWLAAGAYASARGRAGAAGSAGEPRGSRGADVGEFLWVALCVALSILVLRFVFLALVPLWLTLRDAPAAGKWARWRGPAAAVAAAALCSLVLQYAVVGPRGSLAGAVTFARRFDLEPTAFPEEAVAFVADAGLRGRVLNGRASGGPLIYRGYPAIRVLADSRHHFTPAIWELVRLAEDPVTVDAALALGYQRFGLELAVLDGPLVTTGPPPPGFQLLFRAGVTRVWQHRDGPHAGANLAAARRYLNRHGAGLEDDASGAALAEAATTIGARLFLAHPFRADTLARARGILDHGDPSRAATARRVMAKLYLEAGDLQRAEAALPALPTGDDPRAQLYRAAFALARGDLPGAHARVKALAPHLASLPPDEDLAARLIYRASHGGDHGHRGAPVPGQNAPRAAPSAAP